MSGLLRRDEGDDFFRFVLRINDQGAIDWVQPADGRIHEQAQNGGVLLSPFVRHFFRSGFAPIVTSLTSEGAFEWAREMVVQIPRRIAVDGGPCLMNAHRLDDGSVIVGGAISGYMPTYKEPDRGMTPGTRAIWFARFDPDSQILWKRYFPYTWPNISLQTTTSDHGMVTAGVIFRDNNPDDAYSFVIKVDADGRMESSWPAQIFP